MRSVPGLHYFGLAERHHVVRAGIRRAAVGLAIEPLVFEEKDGIVAADGGAQQAGGVERVRWKHHPQPGNVGKDTLAALRVIDGSAGKVAANGHANDAGRGERVVRAPADQRQFAAQLHHGGPDVVKELDLDHRLQSALGHAGGAAHDVGFGDRRVEYPVRTELYLQAGGELEDAALALDQFLLEIFFAAAVGDIFSEDHDALIAAHLVAQGGIDQVGHGLGRRFSCRQRPPPQPWTPRAGFRRRTRWDQDSANTHTAAPCRERVLAPAAPGQRRLADRHPPAFPAG